jgi:hypothetical protein
MRTHFLPKRKGKVLGPAAICDGIHNQIEQFVQDALVQAGLLGSVEVFYQDYFGIDQDFHISIMQTDLESAWVLFENCSYALTQKECCSIRAVGNDGSFPVPKTPTPVDLFAEEITYNGLDISRIDQIGSCTAGLIRNRYAYDADHRLTKVDNILFNPYEQKDAFSSSYSYDPAGNLISLKRNGWRDAVQDYVLIDDISYAYSGNNSVLTSVQEQTGLPEGLAASSHYSYDLNGNLIGDTGKGITQIDYNLLNLPVKVTGQGGGILEFEYTFGGEKIRKNNEQGGCLTTPGAWLAAQ